MRTVPTASKLRHSQEIIAFSMRAAGLSCPHWRPFSPTSVSPFWVTQYFLVIGRKVNSFAAILLVSSSQMPFLSSSAGSKPLAMSSTLVGPQCLGLDLAKLAQRPLRRGEMQLRNKEVYSPKRVRNFGATTLLERLHHAGSIASCPDTQEGEWRIYATHLSNL